MDRLYVQDFDIGIREILLAHQYAYAPGEAYLEYELGRKMYGLMLVQSGEVRYAIRGGDELNLSAGALAFIPAELSYQVKNVGRERFNHFTVNFLLDEGSRSDAVKGVLLGSTITAMYPRLPGRYEKLFEELSACWSAKPAGYRALCKARLYELIYHFFSERMSQTVNTAAYDRTLPAKQFIDEHFDEIITVERLAELCGMSQTNFRRQFRRVYNASSIDYLCDVRIERAKDMLMLRRHSLEEVAARAGFRDLNYFVRFFKSRVGVTPNRFRNRT